MDKVDVFKLYAMDPTEISTKARITFTPPINVVNEPVCKVGKAADDLHELVCTGFQGTYQNEQTYLDELCGFLNASWLQSYNETVTFIFDNYKLSKALKARIYC